MFRTLRLTRSLLALMLGALALCSAHAAADPAWLPAFEQKLAAGGAPALEYLKSLPVEERKTADYEWALARTQQVLDAPEPAAMALVTYDILTRRRGRDVGALRSWLAVKAQHLLAQARAQLAAGDSAGAVRNFLHAGVCDQALIKQPNAGLRDATGRQLARLVRERPDVANYWVLLSGYNFHTGHLEASRAAMNHYLKTDLDPYQRWRGEVWLSSIDHALEKHRLLAEKLMQQAAADSAADAGSASTPEPVPDWRATPEKTPEQKQEERLARHRELVDLDGRIRDAESRLRELQERRRGTTIVDGRGRYGVVAYNQREVKAEIEETEKTLAGLRNQRAALE